MSKPTLFVVVRIDCCDDIDETQVLPHYYTSHATALAAAAHAASAELELVKVDEDEDEDAAPELTGPDCWGIDGIDFFVQQLTCGEESNDE